MRGRENEVLRPTAGSGRTGGASCSGAVLRLLVFWSSLLDEADPRRVPTAAHSTSARRGLPGDPEGRDL
jgi:hypothetical protein